MLSNNIIKDLILYGINMKRYKRSITFQSFRTYHKKRAPNSLAIDSPQFIFPWKNEDFVAHSYETGNPVRMRNADKKL